jgi:hypothetical protein
MLLFLFCLSFNIQGVGKYYNLFARVDSCFIFSLLLERYSECLTTPALAKIVYQGRCDALNINFVVVVVVVLVTDIYFPLKLLTWAKNATLNKLISCRKNVSHK